MSRFQELQEALQPARTVGRNRSSFNFHSQALREKAFAELLGAAEVPR